ncbi:MAG: hypothetical protein KF819_05905 [Labilithrix sp.]|nr:hypothetical protein [Labilithrix sp.]
MKRVSAALSVAVAVALAAPRAGAQEEPEPFAVDYGAPRGCPDAAAFFGEVTARTPRARSAVGGESARVLRVRVEKRGQTHAGRLWIEEGAATSSARDVSGGSCGEVVGALGLVAALAVDPAASVAPRPAPEAAPTPAPTTEPPPSPSPPNEPKSLDANEPARDRSTDPPARTPQKHEPPRWNVGAAAEVAALADAVVAVRIFGERDFGGRLLAPSIRIAASRTLSVDRSASIGAATLAWTAGTIDLCPLRFDLASAVTARPCAGLTVGILVADGSGIPTPRSETRAWVSASAHVRLAWALSAVLALEIEGGALAPMLRESFFFDPNVLVYRAPAIAGFGRLGAGVSFR